MGKLEPHVRIPRVLLPALPLSHNHSTSLSLLFLLYLNDLRKFHRQQRPCLSCSTSRTHGRHGINVGIAQLGEYHEDGTTNMCEHNEEGIISTTEKCWIFLVKDS